mgnify:CR=1 FL=1
MYQMPDSPYKPSKVGVQIGKTGKNGKTLLESAFYACTLEKVYGKMRTKSVFLPTSLLACSFSSSPVVV